MIGEPLTFEERITIEDVKHEHKITFETLCHKNKIEQLNLQLEIAEVQAKIITE